MGLTIGSLAEAAGVKVATVRYYERRGIIAAPRRTASGYRQYDDSVVDRIRFVRRAQHLGFALEEIEELVSLRVDNRASCGRVEAATRSKLDSVESKISELERLRATLKRLVRSCEERTKTVPCPVLEMLDEREGP
ncbi:MAG TPA: MerR family transcriptional regulator [Gemmatimonadaceae bacterium]|nr:MerR family transcriptional regulator [Gemmatimonadaceae bacterium]